MEIKFNGIVADKNKIKFAVKRNNKANIIIFKLEKQQEDITLDTSNNFYVKIQSCLNKTFFDKDSQVQITEDENYIYLAWTMLRKHTQFKNIDVQIQYEASGDIVWQTSIINIDLFANIPADEEIENLYPSILTNFENRIKELEEGQQGNIQWGKLTGNIEEQEDLMEEFGKKVDKVVGKGLSTNDFSNEEKEKLVGITPQATKVVVLQSTPNGYIVINGQETRVFNDQELRELIAGKETGWVIDTQDQITGDKDAQDNYTNVTAITGLDLSIIKIGDNVYIKDKDVPDYWVSGRTEVEGQIILSLNTLSTKIDLSNYYTKQEVIALLTNYFTKDETNTLLSAFAKLSGKNTFTGNNIFTKNILLTNANEGTYIGSTDSGNSLMIRAIWDFVFRGRNFLPYGTGEHIGSADKLWSRAYINSLCGVTQSANTDDIIKSVFYTHTITITQNTDIINLVVKSTRSTAYTTIAELQSDFTNKNISYVSGAINNGSEVVMNLVMPTINGIAVFGVAVVDAQSQSVRCQALTGTLTDIVA